MLIEEFKKTIESSLKENPHHLDTLSNVTCIGKPEEVNNILKSLNKGKVLETGFLERAWPFAIELEDGVFHFLAWDLGDTAFSYFSELDISEINAVYAKSVLNN